MFKAKAGVSVSAPMEWMVVEGAEARKAGVDKAALQGKGPKDKHLARDAVALMRQAVWIEEPLGDRWIAAYRIASEGGRPVVIEARVFPDSWAIAPRPSGRWAGDYMDRPAVPPGGLTATALRRVRLGQAFHQAMHMLNQVCPVLPDLFADDGPLAGLAGPAQATQGQRKREVDDHGLARLARAYVRSGFSIRAVGEQAGMKASTVRGRIGLARSRGLLTRPGRQGMARGELTAKAQALLQGRGRKQR